LGGERFACTVTVYCRLKRGCGVRLGSVWVLVVGDVSLTSHVVGLLTHWGEVWATIPAPPRLVPVLGTATVDQMLLFLQPLTWSHHFQRHTQVSSSGVPGWPRCVVLLSFPAVVWLVSWPRNPTHTHTYRHTPCAAMCFCSPPQPLFQRVAKRCCRRWVPWPDMMGGCDTPYTKQEGNQGLCETSHQKHSKPCGVAAYAW
jgi:hypothetical protein